MTTPSSTIVDEFMMRISDYRLDTIYATSGSMALNLYAETWIIDAADEFSDFCDQSLTYVVSGSATEGYFVEDLTARNKILISKLMTKYWLGKTIRDVLQMQNFVTDRDFSTFSSAQNLTAKKQYYSLLQEELSQDLINYAYRNNDWASWKSQIFDA